MPVPTPSFDDVTPGITLSADGEPLHYRVHGRIATGGTPILVHAGLVSTTEHWPFFVAHFSVSRAVVTWLYRGHGRAPAPRDPRTVRIEQFAEDGHAVSEAVAGGPKVLAGLSMGVQVALEHARRHPDDVQALVLLCGTWGHPLDRLTRSPLVRRAIATAARGFGRAGPIARLALLPLATTPLAREVAYLSGGARRDGTPREVLDELFANVAAMHPRVIGEAIASYVEHTAADVLARITVPTLIIAADRDDLTPVATAERMHQAIVGSRLVVFPGHSHLVQVERPREVHRAIDTFLADHGL